MHVMCTLLQIGYHLLRCLVGCASLVLEECYNGCCVIPRVTVGVEVFKYASVHAHSYLIDGLGHTMELLQL